MAFEISITCSWYAINPKVSSRANLIDSSQ